MSNNMMIVYKCPRYEEKKRHEEEMDAVYFDNKPILMFPYICANCTGLRVPSLSDKPLCGVVIDTKRSNWKKNKRLMHAIRRQKEREKRKAAAAEARKDREERTFCAWNNFDGFCADLYSEWEVNNDKR